MTGPDAAGAHNLFIVEPTGFYAMMSIHAPAARGKLEPMVVGLDIGWAYWIEKIVETERFTSLSCHSNIACWVGLGDAEAVFNPFVQHMLPLLAPGHPVRPMGTVAFTGMVAQIPPVACGLNGDQFGTLAAAYRTAARRVIPVMYGDKVVEPNVFG